MKKPRDFTRLTQENEARMQDTGYKFRDAFCILHLQLYHHLGYPIVNKENKITGVISYKDLFRVKKEDWNEIRVKERMSTRLIYVGPGDSVIEAMEKMTEEGIGRLLVMEEVFEALESGSAGLSSSE